MIAIDEDVLKDIAPNENGNRASNQANIIGAIGGVLRAELDRFEINSVLRVANFLAQICHESDGFCTTVEYASGERYEGRTDLGNTKPGDGPRYKGRGLIQLTGRVNYKTYGQMLGIDLIGQPELAADPKTSLTVACQFWKQHSLNSQADQDDIITVTQRINGGLNGLAERRAYLAKAKAALARLQAAGMAASPVGALPPLRRGSQNEAVGDLQRMLRAAGFALAVDGDFGAATEVAVKHFQTSLDLTVDGIVGPETWKALQGAHGS